MGTPTEKSPELEAMLESMTGRTTAIENDVCVREPYGCGKPAIAFRDSVSRDEYRISGLCQACQDLVFGVSN